jgi:hypothetical protein
MARAVLRLRRDAPAFATEHASPPDSGAEAKMRTVIEYRERQAELAHGRISVAVTVLVAIQLLAAPGTSFAAARGPAAVSSTGEMDCNGYSPLQAPVKPGGTICAEVHANGQLFDNGWYIGHDEPTIQFYSHHPGSSTDVTWVQTLPRDPHRLPTVNGPRKDVTHFFELMPAPWYSMALCDPNSYPQLPCAPDSDTNSPSGSYPGGGSALLELQFYPPGFPPSVDGISCDDIHWCAALTIDSLECTNGFTSCNNDCIEPVNFAFIQTNAVPTGPARPQESDVATFTPNGHTLRMDPGDKLEIRIFDNGEKGALETQIRDLSSGQTGSMLASAGNGFMNTSITDCSGSPWSFRPLYSTASTVNQGGWAAANRRRPRLRRHLVLDRLAGLTDAGHGPLATDDPAAHDGERDALFADAVPHRQPRDQQPLQPAAAGRLRCAATAGARPVLPVLDSG